MKKHVCENCGNDHDNPKEPLKKIVSFIQETGYKPALIVMTNPENEEAHEVISMVDDSPESMLAIHKFVKETYKESWFKHIIQCAVIASIEEGIEKMNKSKEAHEDEDDE